MNHSSHFQKRVGNGAMLSKHDERSSSVVIDRHLRSQCRPAGTRYVSIAAREQVMLVEPSDGTSLLRRAATIRWAAELLGGAEAPDPLFPGARTWSPGAVAAPGGRADKARAPGSGRQAGKPHLFLPSHVRALGVFTKRALSGGSIVAAPDRPGRSTTSWR